MSYQVLARKWRPRAFDEMAGQEHVLRALINGLDTGRVHHAYLFTGTRGVGKTTIARIIARCLNCERGVSSTPCGECGTCREIDEGRFVDLIEVDAASRTKVEDTRELLDNVQYAPTRGRFKVYLIDEIHMLSGHSFNALLKTLEEPPPHVKFLLATTDPQKIPVTILSRCLQFNLKRLPVALISQHLQSVLDAEAIAWEAPAIAELARAADGSMRDALSLVDQAISFGAGTVQEAAVRSMLGTIDREYLYDLLDALSVQNGPGLLAVVQRMAERAPDFADALAELSAILHRLALLQVLPDALGDELPGLARLQTLSAQLSREDVQLYYQIALTGRRDLPLAPDPHTGFEMTVLRMLAFRPATPGSAARRPPEAAPKASAPPAAASPRATQVAAPPAEYSNQPAPAAQAATSRREASPASTRAGPSQPAIAAPDIATPDGATPDGATPAIATADGATPAAVTSAEGDWPSLVRQLSLGGVALALAMQCEWVALEADRVRLRLDPGHVHLRGELVEQRIQKALSAHFGRPLVLDFSAAAAQGVTPAALAERERAQRLEAAIDSIEQDPNVAAIRAAFGAEVVPNSVEPLKS